MELLLLQLPLVKALGSHLPTLVGGLVGLVLLALLLLLVEAIAGLVFYATLFRKVGRSAAWGLWSFHPLIGVWTPLLALHLLRGDEEQAAVWMKRLILWLCVAIFLPILGAAGVFVALLLPNTGLDFASWFFVIFTVLGVVMLLSAPPLVILVVAIRQIQISRQTRKVSWWWIVPSQIPLLRLLPLWYLHKWPDLAFAPVLFAPASGSSLPPSDPRSNPRSDLGELP